MHIIVIDDNDRLNRDVWAFSTLDEQRSIKVRVESFASEERQSVRHRWKPVKLWHRIPSRLREFRFSSNRLAEHPEVPHRIRAAANDQLVANIHYDF